MWVQQQKRVQSKHFVLLAEWITKMLYLMGKWKYFVQLTEQLLPHQDFICGRGVKPSTDVNCSAAAARLCIKTLHKKLRKSLKTHTLHPAIITSLTSIYWQALMGYRFSTLRVFLPHLYAQGRFLWLMFKGFTESREMHRLSSRIFHMHLGA